MMTYAITVVIVVVGLGYLAAMILLSRSKKALPDTGEEPELFVFVVPALNEELVIESTVVNLLAGCGDRGRVLVIDDGSDDATAEILQRMTSERLWVLTRTSPDARLGKGAALNEAYRLIRSRVHDEGLDPARVVLGIVDADGRLEPEVLDRVGLYFRDPRVGAVQLLVRIRNRKQWLCRFQDYEFLVFSSLTQTAREKLGSVGLGGNGQFTRLAALRQLGESPWTDCLTEDLDLGIRIALHGWENRFCGETYVDQQGLTSIPLLIKQRTRWAHGHFQCWKLIPDILRSQLPTVTAFDLSYYLLGPAVVLASSVLFTVGWGWFLYSLFANPAMLLTPVGLVFAVAIYLFSFGPAIYLSIVYWRRSRDLSLLGALVLAHLLSAYNYIWYVAEWKAVTRIVTRKTAWAKTTRAHEACDEEQKDADRVGNPLDVPRLWTSRSAAKG